MNFLDANEFIIVNDLYSTYYAYLDNNIYNIIMIFLYDIDLQSGINSLRKKTNINWRKHKRATVKWKEVN